MLCLLNQAAIMKKLRRDFVVGLEVLVQSREADFNPLLLKDVVKAALREPTMKRHLSALEPYLAGIARARFLSLVTTPCRLAEAGAGAATQPLLLVRGAFRRMQIIKTDCH